MKSGTSWVKLLRQFWKRQLWVFALSCIGMFLTWPVLLMAQISNWQESFSGARLKRPVKELVKEAMTASLANGMQSGIIAFCGVSIGILAAWSGFAALHSREKTDLLHSLPVRREKIFLAKASVAALDLAIPAVLGCLSVLGVAAVQGLLGTPFLLAAMRQTAVVIVFGLMTWAVAGLAMLLTGQLLVGALGTAVLIGIGPLIAVLCKNYAETFYDTYYPAVRFSQSAAWRFTSPVLGALYTATAGVPLLPAAVVTAALLILILAVYKRRPSEAAGRAMAFRVPAELIALVLCFTGAIASGIFFRIVGANKSDLWFVFGLVFGLLVIWAAIRVIYTMDLRSIFSHGATLALAAVLTCGFAAFFRLDLAGFDTYLPARDSISSIDILPGAEYEDLESSVKWQSRLEHMKMGCDDELYGFLTKMTTNHEKSHDGGVTPEDNGTQYNVIVPVTVRVQTKNGRWYTRCYQMRFADISDDLASLYSRDAYLNALYPIRELETIDASSLAADSAVSGTMQECYNQETIKEILTALKEESSSLTPESVKTEMPVAVLHTYLDLSSLGLECTMTPWIDENGKPVRHIFSERMVIWPGFTRTLQAIRDAGIAVGTHPSAEHIREIEIMNYSPDDDTYGTSVTITDRTEIEKLSGRMIRADLATHWMDLVQDRFLNAILVNADGYLDYTTYGLLKEKN